MRRSSYHWFLAAGALLAGCAKHHDSVFVDLDAVLAQEQQRPAPFENSIPKPPLARPALTATVLGLRAVAIEDPANAPKQSIQEAFKAGQASALADLLTRLRELNKEAVQEFRFQQETSITDDEAKAYDAVSTKIRPLFDAWATERAPVFARLALLVGFPDPDPKSNQADPSGTPVRQAQITEANRLRSQLKSIDDRFRASTAGLLSAVTQFTRARQAELKQEIDHLTVDLDKRSVNEANAQIRKAESKLSFRLADTAPIRLPQSPSRHVTIPAEKALEPAPQVPSGGILDGKADRKRLLEHELRIWLALNRYALSKTRAGHRDATQEFQTWRQLHGAGP